MPRKPLSDQAKKAMQEARLVTSEQRADAIDAVTTNTQFTNSKFWKTVPADLLLEIKTAIEKVEKEARREKIKQLEAQLAELKAKENKA